MALEVLTKEDLQKFKTELLEDIKNLFHIRTTEHKIWLRSAEVKEQLNCSSGSAARSFPNWRLQIINLASSPILFVAPPVSPVPKHADYLSKLRKLHVLINFYLLRIFIWSCWLTSVALHQKMRSTNFMRIRFPHERIPAARSSSQKDNFLSLRISSVKQR